MLHVKIVALLIKLIDLGSVIATVRNSGVREKKIVWEIFLTPFEKQNIPKFSVVINLLIVFCEFYL